MGLSESSSSPTSCSLEDLKDRGPAALSGPRDTRPRHRPGALLTARSAYRGDERAYQAAQVYLTQTLDLLDRLGVEAEGHVGPHDPIQAADDGLREFPADLIVFAACPPDGANRLEQDLVEVAAGRYGLPIALIPADSST
jgi:hypothetical protein